MQEYQIYLTENVRNSGAHMQGIYGGGGGGVLATWDRLYTKTILPRHNATDTDLYFYPHR